MAQLEETSNVWYFDHLEQVCALEAGRKVERTKDKAEGRLYRS
jgi:hypothetical protein